MANKKLSVLVATTALTDADEIYVNDDGVSKRITWDDLRGSYLARSAGEVAAAVTPSDHYYPVGDLRRYGAVLNGVADDTTPVSDWLDVGFQGVALIHPGGTALCSTWAIVSTTSDLVMYSNAGGVIDTNTVAFIKVLNDIDVKGLRFNDCKSVFSNAAADTSTIGTISIKQCRFTSCEGAINLERGFDEIRIQNNKWKDCTGDGIRLGRDVFADQDNWKRMVITDNVIDGLTALAATGVRGILVYGKNAVITHNIIDTVTGVSGDEAHGIFTKCRQATITGNNIKNITTGTTDLSCINLKGSPRTAPTSPQGFSTLCADNVCICGGTATGIRARCEDLLVTGNLIDDPLDDGINTGTGDHNRISFYANKIYGTNRASTVGIRMSQDGDLIEAVGNEIHDMNIGIRVQTLNFQVQMRLPRKSHHYF